MGQIPKIIYAQSGTKLTFNVNGTDVALDKEAVEAAGAQSFDELVKSGELNDRDRTAFMKTVGDFSNQAQQGKYKLNTAGPSSLISMNYEGPTNQAGLGKTESGEVAERTGVGRFLSKRLKPTEASHMARLNTILGTKIGAMALDAQAKEDANKASLKVKTDAEIKAKADAEALSFAGKPQQFAEYLNTKLGGAHNAEVIAAMSSDEKLRHAREYFEKTYPEVKKYGKSKDIDFSELEKRKKDGAFDYSPDFFSDFYGRLYEDSGRKQMQDFFGTTPVQKEEIEKNALQKASAEADQNALAVNPNYHAIGEDLVSKSPRINIGGNNYHAVLTKDPKTGKQSLEYVSLPDNLASSAPDAMHTELKTAKRIKTVPGANGEILLNVDGKLFHLPKIGENITPRAVETPSGKSPVKTDISSLISGLKGIPLNPANANKTRMRTVSHTSVDDPINALIHRAAGFKEGGIVSLQDGGSFDANIQKRLAEEDAYEASVAQKNTQTPVETPTETTTTPAIKGKVLQGKGAPTIKDIYGAATDDNIELSEADKLDAGALASDFAGLIIGLTAGGVGGSVVSSGLGLASTIATAKADYLRDGTFGMDDLLKTSLSLTADAATLFPYLGEGAQSLKIVQHIPKIAKLLKYAGYAGMGTGALILADKLRSGEKSITDLDTNDLKLIIGGLRMASAGTSMGKTVRRQPVEEFEGRVINPEGQEIPATFKRAGETFVPKDEALKDYKAVMEKTKFGLGKSRIAGSAQTEVTVTPEETTASSFLGRRAMERRNTMRFGLNKESKAQEIETLIASNKAKDFETATARKAASVETDKLKRTPGSPMPTGQAEGPLKATDVTTATKIPSVPTRTPSNKMSQPTPKKNAPAPTREEVLQEASQSTLSPKIQEILNRVSTPVTTTSTLNRATIKVPRRGTIGKKELASAKQSEKETVKIHKEEAKSIKNKTLSSKRQDSTLSSINKKYRAGGILFGSNGLIAPKYSMPYDPESNDNPEWLTDAMNKMKYVAPIRDIDSSLNNKLMPNSFNRLKVSKGIGNQSPGVALSQGSKGGLGNLKLNLNNKSALQAGEFARVLALNRGIDQRDTRIEAPMVTAPAEVPISFRRTGWPKRSTRYSRRCTSKTNFCWKIYGKSVKKCRSERKSS